MVHNKLLIRLKKILNYDKNNCRTLPKPQRRYENT